MGVNDEITGTDNDAMFNAWADRIEQMDDISASKEILTHIMSKSNLDNQSKELLAASHEYCINLIKQNKQLDIQLLKTHLRDVKGYDVSQMKLINLVVLLGACGINFTK